MRGTMSADAAPQVGDSFGPYRIEDELGEGGMGYVFRAAGPGGEEVALKVAKPDMARDEVFRKRFDREARIASTVKHPHVVPVLDVGEQGGLPYMTQQFIRGGSLDSKIKEGG